MSEDKEPVIENKDLEKAIDEMDILNPENKEVYRVDSEILKLSKIDYKLIENYKDAFDLEQMENRYSDYLLKYDYIVGDIAYQKLRLRGFFDDQRKGVPIDMKISNLEDYLVEFCSFGSPYFVFERVNKKEEDPESYFNKKKSSKGRGRGRRASQSSHKNKQKQKDKRKNRKTSPKQEKRKGKTKRDQKKFQVSKKGKTNKKTVRPSKEEGNKNSNKEFEIRKKKN